MALVQPEKKRTRHVITEVESKFLNLQTGWIPQLRKKAKGEQMKETYRLYLEGYRYCFVGDIRAKLGLSRDYSGEYESDAFCTICVNCAHKFYSFEGYDEYMLSLRLFESHLQYGHGKEL